VQIHTHSRPRYLSNLYDNYKLLSLLLFTMENFPDGVILLGRRLSSKTHGALLSSLRHTREQLRRQKGLRAEKILKP
jgi:hypothetical protein